MTRLAWSMAAIVLAIGSAYAGPLEDCSQTRDAAARLEGCRQTIAGETGSVAEGKAYAQRMCADCHNVSGTDTRSPNPRAPRFKDVANTPGMTVTALTVWSSSTHVTMPNLIIPPDDLENLTAYILSLRAQRP